jgi:acetylornithine deacetylase/succinyl-diaminopimelate desuccinylase-like protein
MKEIKSYVESNKDRFLDELFDLIRIPSISAKLEAKEDMNGAAQFIKKSLLDAGADFAEVKDKAGWPVVYGH